MNYEEMTREELIHQIKLNKKVQDVYEVQDTLSKDTFYEKFAIDENENLWKTILDNIPMVVYMNSTYKMIWINKYCQTDSGYTPEEMMNFSLEERLCLFHPEDMQNNFDIVAKFAAMKKEPGEFVEYEYRMKHKDGSWKWIYSTYSYIFDKSKNEFLALCTALDITDRKEKEEQIKQLNSELEILLEKERVHLIEKEEIHRREMDDKNKELNRLALLLSEKNICLANMKKQAIKLAKADTNEIKQVSIEIIKNIDNKLQSQSIWNAFETQFENANPNFSKNLITNYPGMTITEMRLCSLIKLNITTKIISSILNISTRTIENHRLNIRRKMGLSEKEQLQLVLEQLE